MSHRQKNKHKSRHRIHENNGPSIPQIVRVKTNSAKVVVADAATTPTPVAVDTTVSSPAS